MNERPDHRLRLRLPGGAEFEAEGSVDFVKEARSHFLGHLEASKSATGDASEASNNAMPRGTEPRINWPGIAQLQAGHLQLRAKLPSGRGQKDACLVLMTAAKRLLNQARPTATQLAKWLRNSGYPVLRMDRALLDAVNQGEILSSGSRRSRRYELTGAGQVKALLLAEELTRLISGAGAA